MSAPGVIAITGLKTTLARQLAERLLKRAGYSCDLVTNGLEAVAAVESGAYDLVLMDGQMPELDGYAATQEIRRLEADTGKHIPVIAMTANAGRDERERCLSIGMDEYLSKPVKSAELEAMLEKFLLSEVSAAPSPGSSD